MINKLALFLIIGFCLISCKRNSFETVQSELLNRFKNDPKNRENALLLLNKSKDEKHYTGVLYDKYLTILERNSNNAMKLENQLLNFNRGTEDYVFENDFTPNFEDLLISNLNNAYKTADKVKWKKSIDRQNYLNYILPYKVNYSRPEKWRKNVQADFGENAFKFDTIQKPLFI